MSLGHVLNYSAASWAANLWPTIAMPTCEAAHVAAASAAKEALCLKMFLSDCTGEAQLSQEVKRHSDARTSPTHSSAYICCSFKIELTEGRSIVSVQKLLTRWPIALQRPCAQANLDKIQGTWTLSLSLKIPRRSLKKEIQYQSCEALFVYCIKQGDSSEERCMHCATCIYHVRL